ncbi:MAG TPA: hypothetical protein VH141_32800 [Pseudonocardia sp.]|nr:hypothetical protein [Pseudonocardia sp.]
MTSGPRRFATTLVASAVLALVLCWTVAAAVPGLAQASPSSNPAPAAPAAASEPAAPARGPRLELRVATMTPRVVTSTGPGTLSLTGQLLNTGDQVVHDVEIRAQRGDRLRTEGDVRTALAGNAADDAITPGFSQVTEELAPGQQAPVQFSVPLRGADGSSLGLQRGGVYELLINVNGTPDSGTQARLAGVRMLLPVLGLPATAGRAPEPAVAETPGGPTPVTMLYPIADQPRRLPTGPGEPVLLSDDQLAGELSPGGRLDGLVGALETTAPNGSPVRSALCLAVDPDLLRTVSDMSGGYRVHALDGQESEGRGAAVAGQWLDRLRAVAAGHCVVALPFADADLVALSRAGLDDLSAYATQDSARIAADILRTPVRTDTTWPAEGLLDERSLTDYVHNGGREVVLAADAVAVSGRSSRSTSGGQVRLSAAGAEATGLLADPLIALAARGQDADQPATGLYSGEVGSDGARGLGSLAGATVSPAGSGTPLADQDALGATAFRAIGAGTPTSSSTGSNAPTPLLITPPHRWNTTGTDARELLGGIGTLIAAGRLAPAALPGTSTDTPAAGGLPTGTTPATGTGTSATGPAATPDTAPDTATSDTATTAPSIPSATLVYPLRAGAREVPGTVTEELRADRNATNDLRSAAEAEPGVGATPAQVFDPVTEGLLRAGSAVWRGDPDRAELAAGVITDRVTLLRALVRVLEPPSPYALGDKEAPLPITLANGLPVAMRVRVALSDTPGLHTEAIGEQRIPPMGRLQLRVNAQLTRSGQFSVEARLTTLAGSPLGLPSRLQLRSTAYGTITLWLTGTAGLLLVILAVRRITRRLRGAAVGRRVEGGPNRPVSPIPPTPPTEAPPVRPGVGRAPPVPPKAPVDPARSTNPVAPVTRSVRSKATPAPSGSPSGLASPTSPSSPSNPVTRAVPTRIPPGRPGTPPVPPGSRPVPPGSPHPTTTRPAAPRGTEGRGTARPAAPITQPLPPATRPTTGRPAVAPPNGQPTNGRTDAQRSTDRPVRSGRSVGQSATRSTSQPATKPASQPTPPAPKQPAPKQPTNPPAGPPAKQPNGQPATTARPTRSVGPPGGSTGAHPTSPRTPRR